MFLTRVGQEMNIPSWQWQSLDGMGFSWPEPGLQIPEQKGYAVELAIPNRVGHTCIGEWSPYWRPCQYFLSPLLNILFVPVCNTQIAKCRTKQVTKTQRQENTTCISGNDKEGAKFSMPACLYGTYHCLHAFCWHVISPEVNRYEVW